MKITFGKFEKQYCLEVVILNMNFLKKHKNYNAKQSKYYLLLIFRHLS